MALILQPEKWTKVREKKYREIVQETYGIKYSVYNQHRFDIVRALALLSEVLDEKEMKTAFNEIVSTYYPVNPVLIPYTDDLFDTLEHKTPGYFSFVEQEMWDLWYMYTFNHVMNYAYNNYNPQYDVTFENNINKAFRKLITATVNKSLDTIREEMKLLDKAVQDNPPIEEVDGKRLKMHITFIWKSREDAKVCKVCNELEGQTLLEIPQVMPHYNCRCDFVVYEWWTDEDGNVVADRSYEIEQNKQAKGPGYHVRKAKVTSKLEGGEQITLFEVEKDGKTVKKTYKRGD